MPVPLLKMKRMSIAALILVIGLYSLLSHSSPLQSILVTSRPYVTVKTKSPSAPIALNGPPTRRFRDNLRNDTNYVTCWSNAGLTNQFMGYVNMLYLSTLTDRVPIIPPFAPDHHISNSAGVVPFGDVFDLQSLRKHLRASILEWRDVKVLSGTNSSKMFLTTEVEELGCWTTRKESSIYPTQAKSIVRHLGLDVSFTRVPLNIRFDPSTPEEDHVVLPKLAALIYPRSPSVASENLQVLTPSPNDHWLTPDKHLSCLDTLYYATSGSQRFEWEYPWSPAWRMVGRHLRFTNMMQQLGQNYLRRAFKMTDAELDLPPFIAVHIRRGDFSDYVDKNADSTRDFFPSLDAYKRHVTDIQNELQRRRGLVVSHIIVMSDEVSPLFWDDVRAHGWSYADHAEEKTLEVLGEWWPVLIDAVMQSFAIGFVGTEGSTYSLVSGRRVEDWNGGMFRNLNLHTG